MAAGKDVTEKAKNRSSSTGPGTVGRMLCTLDGSPRGCCAGRPVIFNPDFFVEKLRHENPDVFLELVLSNITRLIDLPGAEFAQLLGEEAPKTPTVGNGGFFRPFNFLKRKDKGLVFGTLLSESSIAQIYQLIQFLTRNLHVEGLFRVPGNIIRQQSLKELLNSGANVDLESGDFHPNDAATLLKSFLGELSEPLLTHRHFHAHLKIADMMLLDEQGNKTSVPNKERQMEALQLLLLLLPQANRLLLKLLLDLLHHTAKQQDKNKMSAFNLAIMFAPHVLWPRHMNAVDLKDNLDKLNNSMAFLIKHSHKLFKAPVYLCDYARLHYSGVKGQQVKDDSELLVASGSPVGHRVMKRTAGLGTGSQEQHQSPAQMYTEEALKELFRHVNHNMPDSAKKKKLVRQLVKETTAGTPLGRHANKKHARSRSFGGIIKRKARGEQPTAERRLRNISPDGVTRKAGKENVLSPAATNPVNQPGPWEAELVRKQTAFTSNRPKAASVSKLVCFEL
ncbi:rho GTPase-activating protein 19 isoform X3 [Takifugu rubripes]|uniref:rho GTPase-activating protein 19 isoform X3 n=1 Tax=Takifugu rubripes TaxID=31033 RepID=UPI0005D2AD12|nr:rho GTPase-activating protein 19-like isoform X3 [Takifugu rubripes]XP_056891988.1 rho GTPase-activating protein 19 isoform X3 [Takifugu flavidus]|eukprot:XP_011610947.1 PREDICTED: rho GTPase-activating protein 19-like isoform X3 [Takifugu rubripes]